jgi:hypothetical protein
VRRRDYFVDALAAEFGDPTTDGMVTQHDALRAEGDEADVGHLPRRVFRFDRMHCGRLRLRIDRLNQAPVV